MESRSYWYWTGLSLLGAVTTVIPLVAMGAISSGITPGGVSAMLYPVSPYDSLGFMIGVCGIALCVCGIAASLIGLRQADLERQVKVSMAGVVTGLVGILFFLIVVLMYLLARLL